MVGETHFLFPSDVLSPYEEGWHGSGRSTRDISQCQHVSWNNATYEEHHLELSVPQSASMRYQMHRYEDTVKSEMQNPFSVHRTRYLLGSVAFVDDPYHSLSVLEPSKPGGCEVRYFKTTRRTVSDTSRERLYGCKLATNAGYFSVTNGKCLGNIVSDGRIVQTTADCALITCHTVD